jgi:subtilase family serine protease
VTAIDVDGQASDGQGACTAGANEVVVTVKNAGASKAADFALRLLVDGENGQAKQQQVVGLEAAQERKVNFDDVRLKKGARHLTAVADAGQAVDEAQENNNDLLVTVRCEAA